MKNVLLTFTGFHDPYWTDAIEGTEQQGPILTALSNVPFGTVYLFATPSTEKQTRATAAAVRERFPDIRVESSFINLLDPTDYRAILRGIRLEFAEIRKEQPGAKFFVATASGTPQMHASWLLLVASGELPGTLLHTRPPRFVAEGETSAIEIDLSAPEFPIVRPQLFASPEGEDLGVDLKSAIRALDIVGDDPAFVDALDTAARFATSDLPVLITGETGTGKEKIAQLVHALSDRASKPLRVRNCAALTSTLAESTLFGHKKGAFTGANSDFKGDFLEADGGTLFLDEFGDLPLDIQAKLLRVLETGELQRLGESQIKKVDVRLIAGTNKDLEDEVAAGRFREDLFYRVKVGCVHLPPLRQRRDDIPKLAVFFVDKFGATLKPPRKITPEAIEALRAHIWPGNVRQLMNEIKKAAYLCRHGIIDPDVLNLPAPREDAIKLPEPYEGFDVKEFGERIRQRLYDRALELAKGKPSDAARLLGVSPQAVSDYQRKKNES